MAKEKILHIARKQLPWRTFEKVAECGARGRATVELDWVLQQQWESWTTLNLLHGASPRYGATIPQNPGERVCKTCWDTTIRWAASRKSLAMQVLRELESSELRWNPEMREARIELELQAFATLARLHRDEFMLLVAGADPEVVSSLEKAYEQKRSELAEMLGVDVEAVDLRAAGLEEADPG